jgi:hypothetical protein
MITRNMHLVKATINAKINILKYYQVIAIVNKK